MSTIHLTGFDWLIIAVYFGFVIGIGFYLRKFTRNQEDFFLAGRRNTALVAGLAFLSANLGALELLGMTGNTFKYGMYVAHFYWIGAIPAMLFLGLYMMPFYFSSRIHSVPGYLKLRFDERTRVLNAIAFAIMTLLVSGINLYAMALVLHTFLGWDWNICMWASAATVATYVGLSGLMSAIFTEVIQFFLIWFGLILVAIFGLIEIGGMQNLLARVPHAMSTLWSTSGSASENGMAITWGGIVLGLGFVLSFGYWTTDFLVVQRAFSARDLRAARMAPIMASFFKMMVAFLVIIPGLVAFALAHDPSAHFALNVDNGSINYDSALPLLIARYYPTGLIGLGVTALLAGFMAGQAGNISAFNTVWTYDLYRSIINKNATDDHLLWMGRVATIVGILISIVTAYWAMSFPSIMDYMQAIFSWVNAPLFATMLLGMFWKRTTSAGAFWGLLAGMGVSFYLFLAVKFAWISPATLTLSSSASDMAANFWRALWAWVICAGLTVTISLFTKPKSDEELKGLVRGMTDTVVVADVPLRVRLPLMAVVPVCKVLVPLPLRVRL